MKGGYLIAGILLFPLAFIEGISPELKIFYLVFANFLLYLSILENWYEN